MTPQVTYSLREIDGGPNYYSQFINSLPSDPNFFPIGVWFESVTSQSDINLDKAAGLNTYVVITANSNFNLIQSNGMYLIAQQDELANNATAQATAEGLIIADEIDMTQGPGTGYATLESRISGLPAAWDNDLLYNNYGKGVMFWETDAQAARFVNGTASFGPYQHIVSADTYWFTDPNIDGGSEGGRLLNNGQPLTYDQTRLAANYGYTVDRMRYLDSLDGVLQPVWNFVEVGWPFTETAAQGGRAIEPEEIQAAVWHSLIAGARGIVYFNHSFGGPDQTQHALRDPDYAEERAAVTETNALIQQLAPVLNSPFDDGFVSVNSSVRAAAHYYQGEHYVFAGATVNGAATAPDTFTLAGITNGTAIVISENRSISIVNGQFSDTFADGNAIHIYHIVTDGIPTPTPGSVSINDVTISEGDSGTKVATFTVTRNGGTAAFDVNFATSNGTATVADSDYVAASNTLHFGANENTQTISVTINGDTKVEANETFNVVLSNATNGATISDSQGVGTITNDDGAATSNLVVNGGFESGNFSGWTLSGNSGGNQIYIAPTDFPGEVHTGSYSAGLGSMNRTDGILTQNIATTAGQHYTLSFWIESDNNGSTPINHFTAEWNGQTLMAVTDAPNSGYQLYTFDVVGINGNSVLEFDAYNHPDAWRLDDVTVTAAGVAVAGSVSINDVTISEGDSGTEVATFTVTRSDGTAAFDVNFATSNGTAAVADSDYVAASNTLHFGASENTQTISVTINGDTKVEANEIFNVFLSNATNGATISDSQGVGIITNDDAEVIAGSISINDVTISEGDSGTEVATFTVTRSGGTAAFDVNFATSNGTATVADSDYVAASNTLHFGANQNTQTISVTINGDTTVEANETFNVVLSNATNGAIISDSEGLGTIISDDGEVIVGSDGNDTLTGGDANDVLDGRGGIDTLFGGAGGDTFVFGDKIQADGDTVMDFVHGVDQLDFHLIDAREFRSGDQAFIFDGYSVGDHPSTRLWLTEDQAANVTHVYADTGPTVFRVDLTGTNLGLTASDFIL